jgi:transcriptional regulator with XRE-family HTH domain
MGCTPRYVAQIEAGRNITLHTIARLAHVLGVAPADLFIAPISLQRRPRGRPSKAT